MSLTTMSTELLASTAHGFVKDTATAWDRENLRDCITELAARAERLVIERDVAQARLKRATEAKKPRAKRVVLFDAGTDCQKNHRECEAPDLCGQSKRCMGA